jgi:glutathione S-transferase
VHLPLVGLAAQQVYGRDFLVEAGIDWKSYWKAISVRPGAARVTADRKAYMEATRKT